MIRQPRVLALATCLAVLLVIVAGCAGTTVTPAPASIPMTLYESTEHGFSIEYPEGWTENIQGLGTQFTLDFTDPEGRLTASVYIQYECAEITRADYVSEGKDYLKSVPQYQLTSERDIAVSGGVSGHEIVGRGDLGTGSVEKFRYVLMVRGKQGFWIGVRGEPADFDRQIKTVNAIVDSLKLLPSFTFAPPEPWPGGTYTGHGFAITIPAGWCQYPPARPSHILNYGAPEGEPSVHISSGPRPEDATLDDYINEALKGFPEYWANFHLLSKRRVSVGGTPAYEIVFTGMSDLSPGYTSKCKYLAILRGEQAYWVMAVSNPTLFPQHESLMTQVIYSFRLQ